jgi:hypothetical protein
MRAMPAERRRELLFVSGHYDASVGKLLGRRPRIVTMLREPAARLRSHYEIVKRMPEHRLHAEVILGMSFREWLDHPQGGAAEENRMTRQVAGVLDGAAPRGAPLDPDALLDVACERLRGFASFGIREAYADSLRLLAHRLRWPAFAEAPRLNATGAPVLAPAERDVVISRNALDAALYRFARRRFRQRLTRLDLLPRVPAALPA